MVKQTGKRETGSGKRAVESGGAKRAPHIGTLLSTA